MTNLFLFGLAVTSFVGLFKSKKVEESVKLTIVLIGSVLSFICTINL